MSSCAYGGPDSGSRRSPCSISLAFWPLGLKIVVRSLSELKPNPGNARTHSRRIADASIEAFGFNNPVLVDEENHIIAGHGRVEAAKLLEMAEVPTVCLSRT